MNYTLLFSPELSDPALPTSDILLIPVIVSDSGNRFAMKKAVKTVKQAFMFDAGFALAQFIEEEGGMEGIQDMLNERGEEAAVERAERAGRDLAETIETGKDPAAPTVEDGVPDGDEGC